MNQDQRLLSDRFPRSSQYHPDWVMENAFGANPLWPAEWLAPAMDLKPGMRVLDLGCGRAKSSIFFAREFGVEVWATDLWISAGENMRRIRDAGAEQSIFPFMRTRVRCRSRENSSTPLFPSILSPTTVPTGCT
jgi:cyclopropane fatty-acyl-phospholipid synthase-like methyltransferase